MWCREQYFLLPPPTPTPTHSVQSAPLAGRREDWLGEHDEEASRALDRRSSVRMLSFLVVWVGWGKGLLGQGISFSYLSSVLVKSLGGVGRQGTGGESEEEGLVGSVRVGGVGSRCLFPLTRPGHFKPLGGVRRQGTGGESEEEEGSVVLGRGVSFSYPPCPPQALRWAGATGHGMRERAKGWLGTV